MAQVYRNIDKGNVIFGLSFPGEFLLVTASFVLGLSVSTPSVALSVTGGIYVLLRLSTMGKPPNYLIHLICFRLRKNTHGGWFSPAARASVQPRLPWGQYISRDLARARRRSA